MKNLSTKFELPPDPIYKDFERSDGNSSAWPTNTECIVDKEGHVNFMAHIPIEAPMAIKWRAQIGDALSNALGWPKGRPYVLRDWPRGYRLFDHHKGPEDSPRHDVYLFGSRTKFRSIPEFIPHAIWLFRDATMNNANCECKYCSKKSQREITSSMGESGIIPVSPRTSPSPSRPLPARRQVKVPGGIQRESNLRRVIHAAIQKTPKLRKPSSHVVQKYPMVADRADDLRAVCLETSKKLRRWYRLNELVWCALDIPIPGPNGQLEESIRFWPAVVEGMGTHVASIATLSSPSSSQNEVLLQERPMADSKTSHPDYDPERPPWMVNQSTRYKVKFLATSCTYTVADEHVLPYQAYILPSRLLQALQSVPVSSININPDYLSQFRLCSDPSLPPSPPPTFEACAGPYALALQIGSDLSTFWGLTDDWEFKFTVFTPPKTATTLQEAIAAATSSNASAMNGASAPRSYGTTDITPSRNLSSDETQKLISDVLGDPVPLGHTLTQKRFQGIWWGAERIWTDDFVRLKLPRHSLADGGAPHVFKPSGPGPAVLASCRENNRDPKDYGARSRGVFMRLDALFAVDVPVGHGRTKKECRASGVLYELADEDWIEENDKGVGTSSAGAVSKDPSRSRNAYANGVAGPSHITLPQPSPLKPAALPNPDPAVPVEETSPQILSQVLPPKDLSLDQSEPDSDSLSAQLSRPVPSTDHKPPAPPKGYKFRPILENGYEAVFSLTMLSGRYYPGILDHPLMNDILQQSTNVASGDVNHLWALDGLSAGVHNSVDPVKYKQKREKMLHDGNKDARRRVEEYLAKRVTMDHQAMEIDADPIDNMEVDVEGDNSESKMLIDP